jgi:hypothetical protein
MLSGTTANFTKGVVGVTGCASPLLTSMGWHPNGFCVPKARIARADINDCYLEAAIKIRTVNSCKVPTADKL